MRCIVALERIRVRTLDHMYFDVEKTLTCGQCFRWEKEGDAFVGIVQNSVLVLNAKTHTLEIFGRDLSDAFIERYFDLGVDYGERLSKIADVDEHLKKAVACGAGIRLLNQAPFETLISFIISSNNNIPKIKMTLEALCEVFGTPIGEYNGKARVAFPTVFDLSQASLEALAVKAIGYRAKSVYETCRMIVDRQLDLDLPYLYDYDSAKKWLKQFHGVGDKVADCILLFAYGKQEAFPVDTWVKKVLNVLYDVDKGHEAFIRTHFNVYPGLSQQVLFYYMRQIHKG